MGSIMMTPKINPALYIDENEICSSIFALLTKITAFAAISKQIVRKRQSLMNYTLNKHAEMMYRHMHTDNDVNLLNSSFSVCKGIASTSRRTTANEKPPIMPGPRKSRNLLYLIAASIRTAKKNVPNPKSAKIKRETVSLISSP